MNSLPAQPPPDELPVQMPSGHTVSQSWLPLSAQVSASLGPHAEGVLASPVRTILGQYLSGGHIRAGEQPLIDLLSGLSARQGDGLATAAVIYQALFDGIRAAGLSSGELRVGILAGMEAILADLDRQTFWVDSPAAMMGLARSLGQDEVFARSMGDIYAMLGADGRVLLRKSRPSGWQHEWIEGTLWPGGLQSRLMTNLDNGQRASFETPAVLLTDLHLDGPEEFLPLVELAEANGIHQVLLVCAGLSIRARMMLTSAPFQSRLWVAAVCLPPALADEHTAILEDLALMTGAQVLWRSQGAAIDQVRPEHLGGARRVWADLEDFCIIYGAGDHRALREHIQALGRAAESASSPVEQQRLLERKRRLMNGCAVLRIGAPEPESLTAHYEAALCALEGMHAASRSGVLPGGGAALLACRPGLGAVVGEGAVGRLLRRALEAPTRSILMNAGRESEAVWAAIEGGGAGCAWDVLGDQAVDMRAAGILDPAETIKMAVRAAFETVLDVMDKNLITGEAQ